MEKLLDKEKAREIGERQRSQSSKEADAVSISNNKHSFDDDLEILQLFAMHYNSST